MSRHPVRPSGSCARRATVVLLIGVVAPLTACGPGVPEAEDPLVGASTGTVPLPDNVGPADCQPVSPARTLSDGSSEIQGAADGPHATLWAKLEGGTPVPNGADVRIVWRVPGSSQLRLIALGPEDQQVEPTLVAPTSAPAWTRPGDAWTSTFRLASPGCWRVNAQRGRIHGDIWFQVG
jgi:hypothetical protein